MWLGNAVTSSTLLADPQPTKPKMYSTSKVTDSLDWLAGTVNVSMDGQIVTELWLRTEVPG